MNTIHGCWRAALAVALFAYAAACGGPTAPNGVEAVRISLSVGGGIAGVNWGFTVDGRQGRIIGNACESRLNCDWEEDQILGTFDPDVFTDLSGSFFDRGFFDGPTDYGNECCDQFLYSLSYTGANDDRTVTGSDGTIPLNIRSLILLVEQFVTNARG